MSFPQFAALAVGIISLVLVFAELKKAQSPMKNAAVSAFFGAASLGAVNLMSLYTGVTIAINYFTSFVAVVLGAPGVICLLMLRLLFQNL